MTLLEDSAVLKNDCTTFIKVLNSVEEILLRTQNLQSTGAIDDVREVLEEALGLMQAVQTRGMLSSTLLAKCEKNRFEELKKKLQEALGRLNLTATLEASALQQAKFDQMEQLRAHVTQLGGAEAVIKDPEALKEVTPLSWRLPISSSWRPSRKLRRISRRKSTPLETKWPRPAGRLCNSQSSRRSTRCWPRAQVS